jgi:tRNA1Val (adenine37-N6)-methyltransferase
MKPSSLPKIKLGADETVDQFLDGRLKLIQSKNGYRFSIDAVLLSDFVSIRPGDIVVDLGTGCGVILLMLLLTKPFEYGFGLEIQKDLAGQAARNALLNGLSGKMGIITGDIKHLPIKKNSADVVLCNPPYRQANSGRINPDPRRAIARHEILLSVDQLLEAARNLLKKKGKLAIIYPAERLVDIMLRMRRVNLEPKRIQVIYPSLESCSKLVLVEALAGSKPGLEIAPPILGQGHFTL